VREDEPLGGRFHHWRTAAATGFPAVRLRRKHPPCAHERLLRPADEGDHALPFENTWLVYPVTAILVLNWGTALVTAPDLTDVYACAGTSLLVKTRRATSSASSSTVKR